MARKVFISFLGAIPYYKTQYYWKPDKSDIKTPSNYVQEAIITKCLPKWNDGDKVVIFTTPEANKNNYKNKITKFNRETNKPDLQPNQGLESVLEKLNSDGIIYSFKAEIIPNGYSEKEIFEVFQTVFNELDEGSEIYFDITFGFRSLPMLGIVLLNYAKNVRGTKVKALFYGNYEAGRADKQTLMLNAQNQNETQEVLENLKKKLIEAPILNLISLVNLQEWTGAAREFIKFGKTDSLVSLINNTNPEIAKQIKGLEKSIATCRGYWIAKEFDVNALEQLILSTNDIIIQQQLKPLIEKIEEKILNFSNNDTLQNGFAAVEWCIKHNMIQQGITFLQETLISHVVEKIAGENKINHLEYRNLSSSALDLFRMQNNRFLSNRNKYYREADNSEKNLLRTKYQQMYSFVQRKGNLSNYYKELTGKDGFRNDINHCGFRNDYLSPDDLKNNLENLFVKIKSINFS